MERILEQMLHNYTSQTTLDRINSIKEVIQEIVLCGLSRAGFFEHAAFYGGTALRIFYGLDRFSEDLDFSLKYPDLSFNLSEYFPILEKEIRSYGIQFKIETKEKTAETNIRSAFLKGNTREHMLLFGVGEELVQPVGSKELIKIKLEIDINPPDHASCEMRYRLLPIPYRMTVYDRPSLFAGKIHAVVCRGWRDRIKGRDLYDYVFYISRGTEVNLAHCGSRFVQTGDWPEVEPFKIEDLKELLYIRFKSIDYVQAKRDVEPFIRDPKVLDVWDADFFCDITRGLKESVV